MSKPRHRVRATSWVPPTAAGLARWRRLLGEAMRLAEHWEQSGLALAAALAAIQRDPYPSRDKADWPILQHWIAQARAFSQAGAGHRAKTAEAMRDANAAACAIFAPELALAATPPEPDLPDEPRVRHRADIYD